MTSDFLAELEWRGLIHQCTALDALTERLRAGPVALYCGFDPTAESLHVGNLIPLITLARFQRAGHRALALVGGATGGIGDPSGKSAERTLQAPEEIARRALRIREQLGRFVATQDPARGAVLDNLSWTQGVLLLDFLRDVGKHFSVNAMMARDSVKSRLDREGEGISFTEFSYMLLQAFDFWSLFQAEGCLLQVGGSDQWGNMCSGVELIRKKGEAEAFALTVPLLTTHDGRKFGKSEKGAVWLDAALTSVWDFFQFWMATDDKDVVRLLKLFTFLTPADIAQLEEATLQRPAERAAQRRLAWEMTVLVHGEAAAQDALATAGVLFAQQDPALLSPAALEGLALALPCLTLPGGESLPRVSSVLVSLGLEASMSRANEAIRSGAVTLNGSRVLEPSDTLQGTDPLRGGFFLVRRGKRHFGLVRLTQGPQDA